MTKIENFINKHNLIIKMTKEYYALTLKRPGRISRGASANLYDYTDEIARKATQIEMATRPREHHWENETIFQTLFRRKERRELRKNIEDALMNKVKWIEKTTDSIVYKVGESHMFIFKSENIESASEKCQKISQDLANAFSHFIPDTTIYSSMVVNPAEYFPSLKKWLN